MENITFSDKESKRFNMNIYRGYIDTLSKENLKKLQSLILKNNIDTVILRIPTEELLNINKIDKLGFPYLVADTLVYYFVDLKKHKINELRNKDLIFEEIAEKKFFILDELVERIFVGYFNHYASNPFFNPYKINEGYKEWAQNLTKKDKGSIGWLVKKGAKYIGFATCSFNFDENVGEGVLYGVLPEFSGGGVYTDLIRFTQNYLQQKGINIMKVSTQVNNYAVQKVWVREGFVLKKSYNTIHINSLLSFTLLEMKKMNITIQGEDIEKFAKISGDLNPVHFDDEFAKRIGFSGRIAHGIMIHSIISKYFSMEFPGNGTLFLSYRHNFYEPIYPNKQYTLCFTFPYYNLKNRTYFVVAKILDENSKLCFLSYNYLIKE